MQRQAGIRRNQNLVIHAAGLSIRAGEQMRLQVDPIAGEIIVHFNFIRRQYGVDDNDISGRGLDGY